jgi:hypothetical protein
MTGPTLLGHLAQFCSFTSQSEVLCTQGLTYLLQEHEEARTALVGTVEAHTGIRISDSLRWIPEALQEDGGRPDLEARTDDDIPIPVVKIEAKLGAELLANQLQSYVEDLLNRNSDETALLVLVPEGRTTRVMPVIVNAFDDNAYDLSGSEPWQVKKEPKSGCVSISIISWDELFAALQSTEAGRFRYELEQLQAMYTELRGTFIVPLASDADMHQWESCETDFFELVNQVTRHLTKLHRIYPTLSEPLDQDSSEREPRVYKLRYVCPCDDDARSCYSIGVRLPFDEWETPIWMRFHRATSNFRVIRDRIKRSNLKIVESGGHIWIPLEVLRDVAGEQMIEDLVRQAEEVLRVAFQTE